MEKNIGTFDRSWRAFLAFTLLLLAFWFGSWILLLASIFVVLEIVFSWCVLYQFLGINTCPKGKR